MTAIFVNIPTTDLERAKAFYAGLGKTIDPNFSDANAACVVWDEGVYLMVLTREYMATFTDREIADPRTTYSALVSLTEDSREAVDAVIEKGVAAGGTQGAEAQDYGFMYGRDLYDPDGNGFQIFWMDPVAAQVGPEAYLAQQGAQG